jgi:DNA-binding Lrp family transcriptional regulator
MKTQIEILIERHLKSSGEVRTRDLTKATKLSRTAIHRKLQELEREGILRLVGKANRARYVRADAIVVHAAYEGEQTFRRSMMNRGLEEDLVLKEIKQQTGIFKGLGISVIRIIDYAFTEMLNNAIDHSLSDRIEVVMKRTNRSIVFGVIDHGVGIFNNIVQHRGLANENEAIQDLLKGKQTTAPDRHSGEGIYFTAKVVDLLTIRGSSKKLIFDNTIKDVFVRTVSPIQGTRVDCTIALDNPTDIAEVFRRHTDEEFRFNATALSVALYAGETEYISRSQARRLLVGLEGFSHITLDFKGVRTMGQGFGDEIFRVWQSAHPQAVINTINANDSVTLMIDHCRKSALPA